MDRRDTLRITPTPENDHAFHCSNCGFLGNELALMWRTRYGQFDSWDEILAHLAEWDVFNGEEPDEDWVHRAKAWERLRSILDKAVTYTGYRAPENLFPFGENGTLAVVDFERWFPEIEGRLKIPGPTMRLRLLRTIQGLPAYISICRAKVPVEAARIYFRRPGNLEAIIPSWSFYQDWSEDLVLATDLDTACLFQSKLANDDLRKVPFLFVKHCDEAILEEIPTRVFHYLPREHESGEFALALCHSRGEVRVHDARQDDVLDQICIKSHGGTDAITFVADHIQGRTQSDSQALAYLDAILAKPWIAAKTRETLTTEVSSRLRIDFDTAVRLSGTTPRLLPYEGEHATFLCRNGIYLKSTNRDRSGFQPCSNFSLRIEESYLAGEEALNHRLKLSMGHDTTEFNIPELDFLDGRKLMEGASKAALRSGWATLPNLTCYGGISQLPFIVRGTQMAPLYKSTAPKAWGFTRDEFQGPDYAINPRGLRMKTIRHEVPQVVQMLPTFGALTGQRWEQEALRFKAREFASWLSTIDRRACEVAGVLFYAALYWLLRGSRGLNSFLALPSPSYLSTFETLTGIQSIQVGRAPREHAGVPRLMASSYWSLEQFQRQGRIVAALEDDAHRLDPRVTCLVHCLSGTPDKYPDMPEIPEHLFALLCYAVVGQSSLKVAFERLVDLVDEKELKDEFRTISKNCGDTVIPPGQYLNRFLSFARLHLLDEQNLINEHRQQGAVLLKRSAVESPKGGAPTFDVLRVAEELRKAHEGWEPLGTYSRKRIHVIRIPEALFQRESRMEED
ncbi:MAG: hypothetical protein P1U86_05855 [Verrucomicrobiales bacterium]|nr:hypothetical protein [Verrucomicrobiales bacterium]